MSPRIHLLLASACLIAFFGLLPAGDSSPDSTAPKPPGKAPLPKAPEFAGYAWVSKFTAEVVKADESKVTMRVYWEHLVTSKSGNRGGRPSLHGSSRNHHSPFMIRRPNVQVKWEHHDYVVPYVAESLVRTKTLPPKIGPDGKKGYCSSNEQEALSLPLGAPAFQATKADLVPGTIIEAHIIRDKTIAANKITDADMRLKYAVILRHDPNPPKDIVSLTPEKKK
jgi:hypothetical protein